MLNHHITPRPVEGVSVNDHLDRFADEILGDFRDDLAAARSFQVDVTEYRRVFRPDWSAERIAEGTRQIEADRLLREALG